MSLDAVFPFATICAPRHFLVLTKANLTAMRLLYLLSVALFTMGLAFPGRADEAGVEDGDGPNVHAAKLAGVVAEEMGYEAEVSKLMNIIVRALCARTCARAGGRSRPRARLCGAPAHRAGGVPRHRHPVHPVLTSARAPDSTPCRSTLSTRTRRFSFAS